MDDPLFFVNVISRWIHVGTAIVIIGGVAFIRFVLIPVAEQLPEAEHQALRDRVLARWKKYVHIGIALFLLSGFYNYIVVSIPAHRGDGLYHALVGTKILLALVVFFAGSALVGRSPAFAAMRENPKRWLVVLLVLAGVIVAISGYVKVRPYEQAMQEAVER